MKNFALIMLCQVVPQIILAFLLKGYESTTYSIGFLVGMVLQGIMSHRGNMKFLKELLTVVSPKIGKPTLRRIK